MQFVPWSLIKSWYCNACGICCEKYDVVLKFPEWLGVVKRFGVEYTSSGLSKLFLRRRSDGSCVFLCKTPKRALCRLQGNKPQACRLWPFKVLDKPKYGDRGRAMFSYGNQTFFIYVDPLCPCLDYGQPTQNYINFVVPEFIEIAVGVRQRQLKSTGFQPLIPLVRLASWSFRTETLSRAS